MKFGMKYYAIGPTTLLLILISICSSAQDIYFKQYTQADGLPSMTTYEMAQDSNGVLWIGTEKGLVSFNGEKFTTYTHPDLNDNDIIKIEIDKNGDILFLNVSHQLGRVVEDKMEFLFKCEGRIFDLLSTSSADYIIANEFNNGLSSNKLYELENDKLNLATEVITDQKYNSHSSSHPENGLYYTITNDSLYLFKNKKRLEFEDKNQDLFNLFEFDSSEYNSGVNFYEANFENKTLALLNYSQNYFVDRNFFKLYDNKDIQRIVVYENINYVILHKGLEVFDANSAERKVLIDDIVVNTVFLDSEHNLWISTRNNGLLKINQLDLNIRSFKDKDQIISGIYASEDHLLITWDDKIEIRNKQNKIEFNFDFKTTKKSKVKVSNNRFLIFSKNKLFLIKPPEFTVLQTRSTSAAYRAMEFYRSRLYCGRTGKIHVIGISPEMHNLDYDKKKRKAIELNNTFALKYSENQDLFLAGTMAGLYKIDSLNEVSAYCEELLKLNINIIEETIDSSFWIATPTKGIYRIKNEKVINHFNESQGLISNSINAMVAQGKYIYAATPNGISQIDIYTSKIVNKNSFNGLPSNYITDLCLFKDSIWLAIQKDIVVIDSSFFSQDNKYSVLVMDEFFCNNTSISFENGMKFGHDENKIDIVLNHVSLSSGENKSMKYRIPNIDTSWTQSNESIIRLPALQPGKYHIEAVGINAVGAESKSENFYFEIKPPWWKTLWARIGGFLLLIGIVNSIIIYRGRRIRKEELLKRDYLGQINKIKDQALQLQMNPHFIFNSLNAIQGFIGTEEEEMAMNYLARFARMIRLIFEHSKGTTISLEEEMEFITLYLDLEKLRFKDKVDVHLTIDDELELAKDVIQVPPLLIQPIVENSFKHGLFHKKGKGNLKIDYSIKDDLLQIVIQDDGIGREESIKISQKNTEKHVSSGIKTTSERLELLNFGKKNKRNQIHIVDLKYDDGNPAGTKTILHLELKDN